MVKKLYAAVCMLGLCAGFLFYNLELGLSHAPVPTPTSPDSSIPGQVRFINSDPALQEAWESIAAAYTEKTGTIVKIIPEEQSVGITPTLFTVEDEKELEPVADLCLDLAGSRATHHLDWSLTLYDGKKMCGLPLQVEGYGLLYNFNLLHKAGQTPGDINSFAKLKEVTQHINTVSSLRFSPFACIDTNNSTLALLACMPGDIRPFVDLCISNSTCSAISDDTHDPTQEFLDGKALFCIGSTAEFGVYATMSESILNIIPLYIGLENETQQGLCVRVENYWCVRNDVSDQDILATLEFLDYLLHPIDGVAPVDSLGIFTPYSTASYYSSPLEKTMREQIASGKKLVVFSQLTAPEGLKEALQAYSTDPTDENWEKVARILD